MMRRGVDGLFIGSQDAASNMKGLEENGVTHILNVATGIPKFFEGVILFAFFLLVLLLINSPPPPFFFPSQFESRILPLSFFFFANGVVKDFKYMVKEILDVDETDILKELQECFDFINQARYENGVVLVHWYDSVYFRVILTLSLVMLVFHVLRQL